MSTDSSPRGKPPSLADQYLDTMVMDDIWRASCMRAIRYGQQQKRLASKKLNNISPKRFHRNSSTITYSNDALMSKTQFKPQIKSELAPRMPTTNHISSGDSDNRSDSCFPNSDSSTTWHARSTRSHPTDDSSTAGSIDVLKSMVTRRCVSCRRTDTTCWRHALGGSLCNSCGLR
jgi:hypothetical protein